MCFKVVYELPTGSQWSFDVQWCPRNPAMISSCSFDGHVSVYSLMGGVPPTQTSNKVQLTAHRVCLVYQDSALMSAQASET